MKTDSSRALYDYWNRIRGTRKVPRRLEIEPSRLAAILPESFILERVSSDNFRFRLAGTRLCEQFGRELRGCNFLDGWEDDDRSTLRRRLASVSEDGAVGLFEFEAYGHRDEAVHFEVLIVPLIQNDTIDRFLGTMSTRDWPIWLGRERLERRLLLRHTLIWPDGQLPKASVFRPLVLADLRNARLVRVDRRSFRVYEGGLSRQSQEKG